MSSSQHPLELMVRKLQAHAPLRAADRAALLALPITRRTVDPLTHLVREADEMGQCTVLISGYAYRQKLTGEGIRQIVSLHIPGEVLDIQSLFLDVADHNVQALTQAEVALIPRQALRDLVKKHPAVLRALFVSMLVEASILREWVLNVGRRPARARIAHLLCEFAVRMDAAGLPQTAGYQLPMTQEQIGDAVGLTSVHVNRTLKMLASEGLIAREKRKIVFPAWEPLREVGDFSKRYLHPGQ